MLQAESHDLADLGWWDKKDGRSGWAIVVFLGHMVFFGTHGFFGYTSLFFGWAVPHNKYKPTKRKRLELRKVTVRQGAYLLRRIPLSRTNFFLLFKSSKTPFFPTYTDVIKYLNQIPRVCVFINLSSC
jgi:hypothetical protein